DDRILIAYDDSDAAKAAIESAGRLFPGRRADVVNVWQPVVVTAPAGNITVPTEVMGEACIELDRYAEGHAEWVAEEGAIAARASGLEASSRAVQARGNIWATLVHDAAEDEPAAIVLGSRGRSGIKSVLLGSVSTGVVHHAPVPVIVVPPPPPAG
ncbi:MAG: universal stress protein, partial [Candidatus Limnocylindria bacterium]